MGMQQSLEGYGRHADQLLAKIPAPIAHGLVCDGGRQ